MKPINDYFIQESNLKLDSLILEITKKQKEITEEKIDSLLENLSYLVKKQKRSNIEIKYLDNQSCFNILELAHFYAVSAHTENNELISLIKSKLKINNNEDWFFPITKIREELNKINSSNNFRIDTYSAYKDIWNYTLNKIISIFYKKYTIEINGQDVAFIQLENDLTNKIKRIKKDNNPTKDTSDKVTEEIIKVSKEINNGINSDQEAIIFIKRFYSGKVESMYIPSIFNNSFIAINKVTPNAKYIAFYDLMRAVIRQGWNFKTEEEFDLLKTTGYKDFKDYKRSTVINILSLK